MVCEPGRMGTRQIAHTSVNRQTGLPVLYRWAESQREEERLFFKDEKTAKAKLTLVSDYGRLNIGAVAFLPAQLIKRVADAALGPRPIQRHTVASAFF
jgi:hypothetical protein